MSSNLLYKTHKDIKGSANALNEIFTQSQILTDHQSQKAKLNVLFTDNDRLSLVLMAYVCQCGRLFLATTQVPLPN